MTRYLITLTPTGRFFFGGDMTFATSVQDTDKQLDTMGPEQRRQFRHTSYIIQSEHFPQQTSLLGMLRFIILRKSQDLFNAQERRIVDDPSKKTELKNLIGETGFRIEENNDFGVINSLSPCFLQQCSSESEDEHWFNLQLVPKADEMSIDFSQTTSAFVNDRSITIPQMTYNPKKLLKTKYRNSETGGIIEEDEIFIQDVRTGISRNIDTGLTENNALFKQISYRLAKGYRFAFYADIDLPDLDSDSGQLVGVGGDSSQFIMGIQKVQSKEEEQTTGTKLVLDSPSYLTDEEALGTIKFAVTETISFKCLETSISNPTSANKSRKLFLYAPGSVFYFATQKDAKSLGDALKKHANFYKIGYNHYHIVNE